MRSPGRIVALSLAAALVVAAGVTAVPATSAVSAPAAASPRSAPDGKLGSFSALGQGIYDPDDTTAYPYVRSVIRWDGKIIAGYDDSAMASGVAGTRSIAAWYDDTWHALGTGTSVGSGAGNYGVFTLNAFTDDTLVAAGSFQNASGVTGTTNLAAWSKAGSTWASLGGTVTNDAYALAKWTDDTLIVAGAFNTTAPSTSGTNHVAGWSRGTWHSFGLGVTLNAGQGDADALASWTDDTFVVGGFFDTAIGVANTRRIAAWSNVDDTWHPLGRGVDDTYIPATSFSAAYYTSSVDALAVWADGDDTKLVAGGIFSSASGVAGTSNIAVWSSLDDTWHSLGGGLAGYDPQSRVRSLAVDDARDLIYAGGRFDRVTGGGFLSLNGIGVWDAGIDAWIPLRFDTITPYDNGIPEFGVHSILVEDSVVYVGGEIRKAGRVASANGIAKWTWQPPQGSSTFTSLGTSVTGEGFVGVPATGGVTVGTATATYTRDDSTHITITSIAGSPAAGAEISVNGVGGWGVVGTCAPPVCANPAPPPPPAPLYPPGAPTDVRAVAGDDTALISWTPPTVIGSGPVTSYYVFSAPRTGSCTATPPTTSCVMTGLTKGTTYTFQVQAINTDGASSPSAPSNAVTPGEPPPPPPPTPSILITGSRNGQRITITGTAMHLDSQSVRPWIKFPGQKAYTEGAAVIPVAADGTFTWSRKTNKKTYVYVAHDATRSNMVTIPAR